MTGPRLRPGLRWLRDHNLVQVVIDDSLPALQLSGAEAQLWEGWVDGLDPMTVVDEVARCWQLPSEQVLRLLAALLERLSEAGAIIDAERQESNEEEAPWPTCS